MNRQICVLRLRLMVNKVNTYIVDNRVGNKKSKMSFGIKFRQ